MMGKRKFGKYMFNPDYEYRPELTVLETIELLGMTKDELAHRSGLGVETLDDFLWGSKQITAPIAEGIERATGLPASLLMYKTKAGKT